LIDGTRAAGRSDAFNAISQIESVQSYFQLPASAPGGRQPRSRGFRAFCAIEICVLGRYLAAFGAQRAEKLAHGSQQRLVVAPSIAEIIFASERESNTYFACFSRARAHRGWQRRGIGHC